MTDNNHNIGNRNTGNRNTGDYNTGDYNPGDRNTGYWNTGDCNTGNFNTGNNNTGYHNTGWCNTGDNNSGSWNTASCHVGCFNTVDAKKAYYFNKLIDIAEWDRAEKPDWTFNVRPTTWVHLDEMTDAEKAEHPESETTGGYLRVNNMREQWAAAYAAAPPEQIELTKALPGFDAEVFLEITGVDLRDAKPDPAP